MAIKFFSKKNSEYGKPERYLISVASFIVFALVGGAVRLFGDPISFSSVMELLAQFLPYMLGFGVVASILAYFFPKVFNIILCFLPLPGINN